MSDDISIEGFRGSRAGRYGMGAPPSRAGMDPDMRRMLLLAGGFASVLALLIGASALIGHRGGTDVPVVQADPRPIRVKPENPGGMKIDGSENDLFATKSDTATAKLAPPPEAPDTQALRDGPQPPAAPVPPKPAIVAAAPPLPQAAAKPAPAAPPAPAKPAPSPTVAAKPAPVATGKTAVQLAALGSEEAARNEWALMSKKMPELLAGRQPSYSRTERDGKTFWRVRTAGFADVAQARDFCEHMRAKGGTCSVADF